MQASGFLLAPANLLPHEHLLSMQRACWSEHSQEETFPSSMWRAARTACTQPTCSCR